MDKKQLQVLANELAKNLKAPDGLSQFDRLMKKISVETVLDAEMSHHLGYDKNQNKSGSNTRNGYSTKTVTIAPFNCVLSAIVRLLLEKKNQTRTTRIDNHILSLYAAWPPVDKDLYDADASHALVSKVTDVVMEQVVEWQSHPLDEVYPIV